jgi:HlyD family secretion protein
MILPVVLAGCGKRTESSDSAEMKPAVVETAQAVIRPMEETVSAQGTLAPPQGKSARVAAVTAGNLVAVMVREGDRVTAGQVIATVDSRTQQAQAQSAVSALRASEIQAKQMSLEAQAASTEHENAVKLAKLELEAAKTEIRKLRNGARPQEIAQADQAVNEAQANLDRANTELERVTFLNQKGVAAKRDLDDAKTAQRVAAAALESARQQADLVRSGTRSEDLAAAQLTVESAQAALEQAMHGDVQVAAKKQEAQAALESVQQKRADLSAAQTAAGYAVLRAPLSGIVIHRNLNPGDMADPSTPVIEIANSQSLDILANIPEEDGMKIETGMPVRITAATAPAQTFAGGVLSIGQVDPASGLLAIRISVSNPSGKLKAGAFATADIVIHTFDHATAVPKQAVITRDGKNVAFVVGSDNVAHQRQVVTGVEQNGMIQILSGVTPGEQVIRLGQYELTDGMKVQPAQHS